jgi:hypothetical protein
MGTVLEAKLLVIGNEYFAIINLNGPSIWLGGSSAY